MSGICVVSARASAVPNTMTYEETVARMEHAKARQLLQVLTALDMGHVLPVFASQVVVQEALRRVA